MSWKAVFSNPTDPRYKTRAAFMLPGRRGWSWITWEHRDPSKHAAIIKKARELGATSWDFGNADHYSMADYPAGRGFSANPTEKVQIVLARTEEDYEVVRPGQSDIGIPAKTRVVLVPKALIWLRKGTAADVAKAEAHARSEGWRVFTYPTGERDPLGRAKKDVLR